MKVGVNARGLSDPNLRGFNRYTFCLLKELQQVPGVDVVLYTDDRSQIHSVFRPALDAEVISIAASSVLWWEQVLLPQRLREDGIDVFHAPCEAGLPVMKVCPQVLTFHGIPWRGIPELVNAGALPGRASDYLDTSSRGVRSAWRTLRSSITRRAYLRSADAVITVSDFSRHELIRFLKLVPQKVRVIHEAADGDSAGRDSDVALEDTRLRHGLPARYLLFVGGFERHKNVSGLLSVFAEVRRAAPDTALVVVADGEGLTAARADAAALGLVEGRDVSFLQRLADDTLRDVYRCAAAFVTLSWHEGFCLPVLEAMASNTPVVASRFGAIPEIAGDAAVLVDPRSVAQAAAEILRVLRDPARAAELKARGRRRAAEFSWRRTAAATIGIYEELVAQHAPRDCTANELT